MRKRKFIDLAAHGGCSKKVPALQLTSMLQAMSEASGSGATIDASFSDSGFFKTSNAELLSSIDVVLPMTPDPQDFGEITVSHVLSDLYAAGASPLFALCVLGLPNGVSADDPDILDMMVAANRKLNAENTQLIGGHTLAEQQDLYLGFAAVGAPWKKHPLPHANAKTGDQLVLTKPLGTSIASLRWKFDEATTKDHQDVLDGMKLSNRMASKILVEHRVSACTDVTGYGLLGHLHEVLLGSKKSAVVNQQNLVSYASLEGLRDPYKTQQFHHNRRYVDKWTCGHISAREIDECHLFDAQVSGGLLFAVAKDKLEEVSKDLLAAGYFPHTIGEVTDELSGSIRLSN